MNRSVQLVFTRWRWLRRHVAAGGALLSPSLTVELEGRGLMPSGSCVTPEALDGWESRHGFRLPGGLRAWLSLSDGLYGPGGPLVHPLRAIGPMVRFDRVATDPLVQPESWYEFGNPGAETVCLDLAYRWPGPGGGPPVFASGDGARSLPPRIIAPDFDSWLGRLIEAEGRPFWREPGFQPLGDPWTEHRRHAPVPPLPDRLRRLADAARLHLIPDADERRVAGDLGISTADLESLFRYLQHTPPPAAVDPSPPRAMMDRPDPGPPRTSEDPSALTAYVKLARLSDLPPGSALEVEHQGRLIALFREPDGTLHALDGMCPHQGGPLAAGRVENGAVTCPWHGWAFDLQTGRTRVSRQIVQPTFPVRVHDDEIWVELPHATQAPG